MANQVSNTSSTIPSNLQKSHQPLTSANRTAVVSRPYVAPTGLRHRLVATSMSLAATVVTAASQENLHSSEINIPTKEICCCMFWCCLALTCDYYKDKKND